MTEKTIAIYARYSSDLQNPLSCEDQIALCKEFIERNEDFAEIPTKVYSDTAISGTLMKSRPSVMKMAAAVEKNKFSYIVAEALDRISRSTADMARFYKICQYHGVRICTVHEGLITELSVGLTSTMSAIQISQIRHRTRRGQKANIGRGKSAGGLAYGYKKRLLNDKNEQEDGLREIVPEHAKIVQRIYDETCQGLSPSQIAFGLNEDNIPSPRGKLWGGSTISGHYGRGNGILQNPLYKGVMVWNRHNFEPHPITGVRHVRKNDEKDLEIFYNPNLRIISDEQWEQVRKIREKKNAEAQKIAKVKSRIEIGFRVKCAQCGSNMNRHSEQYIICGQYKRSHQCSQSKKINLDHLFSAIYEHLEQDFDEIWQEWKLAVAEENARQKDMREGDKGKRRFYKTVLDFDDLSKSILLEAIKEAGNDQVKFVQRIIAEAAVDKGDAGIIVSHLLPKWKEFKRL